MRKSTTWAFVFLAALSTACSSGSKIPDEVALPGSGDLETVVVMGTNDIHGTLAPVKKKSKEEDPAKAVSYEAGGAAVIAGHVKRLRAQFGQNLMILDAGDQFQGSIESNIEEGAPMVKFFNQLGLSAAAVGNHEFDFGPEGSEKKGDLLGALKARMKEAKYPYVAANIVDRATGKLVELPNTHPHVILNAGRLKVGVIGLSTLDTPVTTFPEHVKGLKFTDLKEATLREAKALRAQGVHVILITAHVGLSCHPGKAKPGNVVRRATDPQGACNPDDELVKLLHSLPQGTVDAVVSGHSHQIIHHWINGVPVIQAGTRNQYYNLTYLTYDWSKKKIVDERTLIQGPIPVCEKIFENQGDCNGDRPAPAGGRGSLVEPELFGRTIYPDDEMAALIQPTLEKSETEKKRVIGHAARPVAHERNSESELGNLVADALRASTDADVAVINGGGIRAPFEAGPITYETVFRTLPFDNNVSLLTVTGRQLKNTLRVAESGARGFFPVSGVQLRIIDPQFEAPSNDLNKDSKVEPWEVDRLIEVRLSNGDKIKDTKKYRLATVDFLVLGGDNFGWAMSQIPQSSIQLNAAGVIRDVVMEQIAKTSPINTVDKPLLDLENPRLKFQKGGSKKREGKRRR